jgi:hypothetical protein
MELLKFIQNNQISNYDILKNALESEPYNLKIKEDNNYPSLFLIHNMENSNKELDIVRECNGIILDKNNFKIVCYTFNKLSDEIDIPEYLNKDNLYIENAIEGTLVRYFNYNEKWILSTKKCIDASKSRWVSTKTFHELFEDCLFVKNIENITNLNPNYCYSFIITHPDNNIVVKYTEPVLYHISTRDMVTMSEIEVNIDIVKSIRTLIPKDNIKDIIQNVMITRQLCYEGVIFIDSNYNRWKFKSPYFNRAREIWGNTNNRLFRYIELRKDVNLLDEYLMYFPNDQSIFSNYEYRIKILCSQILSIYTGKHILKDGTKIPYYLAKIIYKLHGDFFKDKIRTDLNKIGLTLLSIDSKLLCFMLNHYEKNLVKEDNLDIMNEDVIQMNIQDEMALD